MSELYDDFPSEFYTPTPSSYSGYSPSEVTTQSSDSSPVSLPPIVKKHARIDSIRNSGMEQLEAFLTYGNSSSSDLDSFESCIDSFSEDGSKTPGTPPNLISTLHANNNNKIPGTNKNKNPLPIIPPQTHINHGGNPVIPTAGNGTNRTGAISRLGHSSAVGHLQKILTDAK